MSSLPLTRAQFDVACKAYIAPAANGDTILRRRSSGWTWREHPYVSQLGYLARTVQFLRHALPADVVEELDGGVELLHEEDGASCTVSNDIIICDQYVVYSSTFGVPVFYWTLHDPSGSPLTLDEITKTPIFRRSALPPSEGSSFALTLSDSSLPLLSQGDHPTLGTPSWHFHPCHTANIVGEIMAQLGEAERSDLRWLEAWFMVMGNIVDLFLGV